MIPYTEKYTKSEYHIQNSDLLYTIHQQCQNTFENTQPFRTFSKTSKTFKKVKVAFCNIYKFHNSCFVPLATFVFFAMSKITADFGRRAARMVRQCTPEMDDEEEDGEVIDGIALARICYPGTAEQAPLLVQE